MAEGGIERDRAGGEGVGKGWAGTGQGGQRKEEEEVGGNVGRTGGTGVSVCMWAGLEAHENRLPRFEV